MALDIKNKNTGDLLTATEFNLLVQAVKDLETKTVKMVALSQTEYDTIASAGSLDAETYYNILEED